MKRIIILCITVALAAAVACQTEFDNKSFLDKMATDTAYLDYRTAVFFGAAHVVQGLYDLESIGEVIKQAVTENICDYPDLPLAEIRGGLLYRDTQCTIHRAASALNEKYPEFWTLSDEDKLYLKNKYDEIMGGLDKEELMQLFKARFNED